MKVLMFGWEFPPHNAGGLGVACKGLSEALSSAGIELVFALPKRMEVSAPWCRIVFADKTYKGFDKTLYAQGFYSPYRTDPSSLHKYAGVTEEWNTLGPSLFDEVRRYAFFAGTLALEESFDVIHAHDWLSIPAGLEAKRISGKPLIVHIHATEFDRAHADRVNEEVYAIERAGVRGADHIIAVSNYTKRILIDRYGASPEKITVVHNGINMDEWLVIPSYDTVLRAHREAGGKVVLFVGRITLQKGPDYFIGMAKRVLEYEPNTLFVISGSGDMERQIIEHAAWLKIGSHVLFAGFLRGEELRRMYMSADVLVMPSVSEPFGIVPLESIAHGTPVIISKQSGVSEVLKSALKVDFWDTEEMANKLISALRHDALRATLATEGLTEVQSITWHKAAHTCIDLYHRLTRLFNPAS